MRGAATDAMGVLPARGADTDLLASGVAYATGVVRSVGDHETLWWHVAIALGLIPLVVWHVVARPARPGGSTCRGAPVAGRDLAGIGIAVYAAAAATTRSRLPGSDGGSPGRMTGRRRPPCPNDLAQRLDASG